MSTTLRELMQKKFYIPFYQRNYSWQKEHVIALLEDYDSAITRFEKNKKDTEHYLANIILMDRKDSTDHFECRDIIDGQQRLTTIIMILNSISKIIQDKEKYSYIIQDINNLIWPPSNKNNFLLNSPGENQNIPFLEKILINGKTNERYIEEHIGTTKRNIRDRYFDICQFLLNKTKKNKKAGKTGDEYLESLHQRILQSAVTSHKVDNIVEANRIFITLNARGKPLSSFDKIKGLLIYFSAQAGRMSIANAVHMAFTKISEKLEDIDNILHSESPFIKLHPDGCFNEDTLISWHYCVFEQGNQIQSPQDVYDKLDASLRMLQGPDLESLIKKYIDTAIYFSEGIYSIAKKSISDPIYFETIAMCQISSIIWPLAIACEHKKILDSEFSIGDKNYTILIQLRLTDKIHRLRRSQGRQLIRLAHDVFNKEETNHIEIATELFNYHKENMRDKNNKRIRISDKIDFTENESNDYWNYLLLSYVLKDEVKKMELLREHRELTYYTIPILRSYPEISIKKHGFSKRDDFELQIKSKGNFILIDSKAFDAIGNHFDDTLTPVELRDKIKELLTAKKRPKNEAPSKPRVPGECTVIINSITADESINKRMLKSRAESIEAYWDSEWDFTD